MEALFFPILEFQPFLLPSFASFKVETGELKLWNNRRQKIKFSCRTAQVRLESHKFLVTLPIVFLVIVAHRVCELEVQHMFKVNIAFKPWRARECLRRVTNLMKAVGMKVPNWHKYQYLWYNQGVPQGFNIYRTNVFKCLLDTVFQCGLTSAE